MERNTELTERLLKNYIYDMETHDVRNIKSKLAPKPIDARNNYREIHVTFRGKKIHISYHHLVWLLVHHEWPTDDIDHIDGDPTNNRIDNLRVVSRKENSEFPRRPWKEKYDVFPPVCKAREGLSNIRIQSKAIRYFDPYGLFFFAILCGRRYY